ncbi:MAG: hypothetical protein RMI01_08850, partial [Thermodesulfovibrio sp.]|nr:hypothetical protein [Thermodesulfovibrio sp.]
MADDVLSQLGVNLPPLPSGNEGIMQAGATAPVTEGMEAPRMESMKELAFIAGAGCITAIEQIMLP